MRTSTFGMVAAVLLASAVAHAQEQAANGTSGAQADVAKKTAAGIADVPVTNEIDLGLRGTSFDSTNNDAARFQRYRDLRDGGFLDKFRFGRDTGSTLFDLQADHVGYRDQRYAASFNRFGKAKASFEWNQVPLFYSQDTSWLYGSSTPGELRIANTAVRTGIQNGTLKVADVNRFLGPAFDLRQRRDIAAFKGVASVGRDIDLKFNVTSTHKEGQMPWGASFGFSAANEVGVPIDHRTNDVGASLEYANAKGMIRVGYDGSWFVNQVPTLVFDSPFKLTDSTNSSAYVSGNGTSQGRTALWPDSMANTISAAAAYNLPGHSRLNGAFSIGQWSQNASLLPFTINTAIDPIRLDRPKAEAEARITNYNVSFNSRPVNNVWFTVRARRYDFDNRTPEFKVTNYVRLDQVVEPSILGRSEPFGYTRDYVDADASFTPIPYTALKIGYGLEKVDRMFRYVEQTKEHTLRTAIDTSGNPFVMFRLAYEHAKRVGTGLDEEVLDEIGEQVSLRQYDISDRDRDRVTALVQVTPIGPIALTASASTGRDKRPNAYFGLQKLDTNMYSVGFDVTPASAVAFGLNYMYEDYTTAQGSRNASPGPQFNDPTRDWFTDVKEKVHYVVADAQLIKAIPRTNIRFAYDWNRSNANYSYRLAPNSTLATPVPLPTVYNELNRASVDFKYFLTRHFAAGFIYLFDQYKVDDFALSPSYVIGNRTLADGVMLGYFLRPYTAHSGWFRITYLW